ncbi:MAG: hypothetical protein U9Q76_00250, partial [candidate division WOR-3 bacterium]|nr:hypothetical protein [candidate division WOR-3 bacterium]
MGKKASARKTKPNNPKAKAKPRNKDNTDIVIGLLLLLLAGFVIISLASFKATATMQDPSNWGGMLGFLLARELY